MNLKLRYVYFTKILLRTIHALLRICSNSCSLFFFWTPCTLAICPAHTLYIINITPQFKVIIQPTPFPSSPYLLHWPDAFFIRYIRICKIISECILFVWLDNHKLVLNRFIQGQILRMHSRNIVLKKKMFSKGQQFVLDKLFARE